MPRCPRLDAPGALHHVVARGIERTTIFRDDRDANDFIARVARLASTGAWRIYAWALMPNHVHLLVRTGDVPLGRSMRSLLTGHAVVFNRRHGRVGHLFQNRYKSILCEDDAYFLELVRYIHLNPVRAGLLADPRMLDRHPYTGHATVLGRIPRAWQATHDVLATFGGDPDTAVERYRSFVLAGSPTERRPELVTGWLLRRPDGRDAAERAPRRGRDSNAGHERVLGTRAFRASLQAELRPVIGAGFSRGILPAVLIRRVALLCGIHPTAVARGKGSRARAARALVAFAWLESLGRSGSDLARHLGISRASVYRAALRARRELDTTGISSMLSIACEPK